MKKALLTTLIILSTLALATAQTPVAHYPLNGNANDASGNGLHGTVIGTVTPAIDRFGNNNSAMQFDGTINSRIVIADNALLRPSSITISAWVNVTSQNALSAFVSKSIGSCMNDSWHLGTQDGYYSAWISRSFSCGDFTQIISPFTTSTWKFIVFTMDDASDIQKLYVNGIEVASASFTSLLQYDNNPVILGGALENTNPDFPLNGILDDVKIYNVALTQAEIVSEFNSNNPTAGNYRTIASGDWNSAGIWERFDGNGYIAASNPPSYTDNVIIIQSGHTVTVNSGINIDQTIIESGGVLVQNNTITLNNGTGDDLQVNGTFTWNSNTINGSGNISISTPGLLNLVTAGNKNLGVNINNKGTLRWQAGNIFWSASGIVIQNTGIFSVEGSMATNQLNGSGNCIINNSGTFQKSSTTFSLALRACTINNSGVTTVTGTGVVSIETNSVWNNTGVINLVSGGLSLNLTGILNINAGSSFTGNGNIGSSGGPININTETTLPTGISLYSTGTITCNANLISNGTITVVGNLTGNGNVIVNGSLSHSGNIGGSGNLLINGSCSWTSGTINRVTTIATGGQLNLTGSNDKTLSATVINNGTISWQAGGLLWGSNNIDIQNAGIFSVDGALTSNQVSGNGSAILTNSGTFRKTVTGTAVLNYLSCTNNGTLSFTAGTTQLNSSTWNNNGTVNFSGSAVLSVLTSTFHHNSGSFTGTGTLNINNAAGIINIHSDLSLPSTVSLDLRDGILTGTGNLTTNGSTTLIADINGSGTLNLNGTPNTWSGKTLGRNTTIAVSRSLTMSAAVTRTLAANITNNGTITWSGGDLVFAVNGLTMQNSGTFTITTSTTLSTFQAAAVGNLTIQNNGTFRKLSPGSCTLNFVSCNNNGTINVGGGTLNINECIWNNANILTGAANSVLNILSATYNHNTGASVTGQGTINLNHTSALLNLNADMVLTNLHTLNINSGILTGTGNLTTNGPLTINSTVTGSGMLTANDNSTWTGGSLSRVSTFAAAKTLTLNGSNEKQLGANLTGNGTIAWTNGNIGWASDNINIQNNGLLSISGNNQTNQVNGSGNATIINSGTIQKNSTGETILNHLSCTNTGTIKGLGTINWQSGTMQNNGILSPGLSPGQLQFNGQQPFSASSILEIEMLNESGPGTGYDQLIRNGSIELAGTLTVTETGTIPPGSYTIVQLTSGTITGSFSQTNLPQQYSIQVNQTSVVLIKGAPCNNPAPVISASGPLAFCAGGSVTLISGATTGNTWSNGEATQSITVSNPGDYHVTVTDINGCSSTSAITTVNILPAPAIPDISVSGSLSICHGNSVTLTSGIAGTYLWSNGETTQSITVSSTEIFSVIVFNNEGCPSLPSAEVSTTLLPEIYINTLNNIAVSHGAILNSFSFTGNATSYAWTNDNTSIGLAASGSDFQPGFTALNTGLVPSVANIVVTPYIGQCAGTPVSYTITVNPPAYTTSIPNQTKCTNTITDKVIFNNLPGVTYSWTNDNTSFGFAASGTGNIDETLVHNLGTVVQVANISVTPAINGIDQPSFTFFIKALPVPVVAAMSNSLNCSGTATVPVIFAGNATEYEWTNNNTSIGLAPSGTGNIPSFIATAFVTSNGEIGNIQVRPYITDGALRCQGISEIFNYIINPTPVMSNVADRILCPQASAIINFSGVGATAYEWTNDNINISLPLSGIGNIGQFNAYNVTGQNLVGNIVVTPKFAGNGFSCYGEPKNFQIVVKAFPDMDAVASTQRYCSNQQTNEVIFSGNIPGNVYTWTNSNPSIGVAASGTGNVPSFITINNGNTTLTASFTVYPSYNGCTGNPRIFDMLVSPHAVISPIANQDICNNGQTNIVIPQINYATNGFEWTSNNTSIGVPATYTGTMYPFFNAVNTGTTPLTAIITVSEPNQTCPVDPVSFTITVHPSPVLSVINSVTYCSGATTLPIEFMSSLPGTEFTWSSSNTLNFPLPATGTGNIPSFLADNPATSQDISTTIFVGARTYVNGNVCQGNIRSFDINIKKKPAIFTSLNNKVACHGETVSQLFNGNTTNFRWTNSDPSIGLPASGNGNINFVTSNTSTTTKTATITVYPVSDDGYNCEGTASFFTIIVNPQLTINDVNNLVVCNGAYVPAIQFSSNLPNTFFTWISMGENIGTVSTGNSTLPGFVALNNNANTAKIGLFRIHGSTNSFGKSCSAIPKEFTITVYPNPVVSISPLGSTTFCQGGSVILRSNLATGNIWSTGETTQQITVTTAGSYYVQNTNNNPVCSTAVSNVINVVVTPSLTSSATISASATTVCRLVPVTFTANITNLSNPTYKWFVNNQQVSTAPVFTSTSLLNNQTVNCTITGTNPCTNTTVSINSNIITINVLPSVNAGTIVGASTISLSSVLNYTTNGNAGGTWSTDNTSVLTVNPATGAVLASGVGSANLRYTISSGCSAPAVSTKLITVISNANQIVGADGICITGAGVFAANYNYITGVPTNGTWSVGNNNIAQLISSPAAIGAQIAGIAAGTTTINYTLPNGGGVISKTITVNQSGPLSSIEGPRNLCYYALYFYFTTPENQPTFTYTRPAAFPSTGYNWTVPDFLQIVSGQGTTTLTVKLISTQASSGLNRLYATPINYCPGTPDPYYADLLMWSPLPAPSPIIASTTSICESISTGQQVRYTINKVPDARYYYWSFPAGVIDEIHPAGTGINDTTVLVRFTNSFQSGGSISVMADNGCGGELRSLVITKAAPAQPSLITGPTNTCAHQLPNGVSAGYSVTAVSGMTYTWLLPSGATNVSGQGTNSISFKYPNGFTSGIISVTATNGCGTSTVRTLNVTTLNPAAPGAIDVIQMQSCPDRIYSYTIAAMPSNAQSLEWTVPSGGVIVTGQGTTSIRVVYSNAKIIGVVGVTAKANCKNSATRTTDVKLAACPSTFAAKNGVVPGIKETVTQTIEEFNVNIFPNPSTDIFNLKITSLQNEMVQVRIMDMQGRLLKKINLFELTTTQFGTGLDAGVYLVEIKQGTNTKTMRIVKY
ncbi:MAG: T9SS type A sorting domain-containing protein [Ferruginibacter sp.]